MLDFRSALLQAQGTRTTTEFASELGVSYWTLRNWTTGRSVPRSATVLRTLEPHGITRELIAASRNGAA